MSEKFSSGTLNHNQTNIQNILGKWHNRHSLNISCKENLITRNWSSKFTFCTDNMAIWYVSLKILAARGRSLLVKITIVRYSGDVFWTKSTHYEKKTGIMKSEYTLMLIWWISWSVTNLLLPPTIFLTIFRLQPLFRIFNTYA